MRTEIVVRDSDVRQANVITYYGWLVGTGFSRPGARITEIREFMQTRLIVEWEPVQEVSG